MTDSFFGRRQSLGECQAELAATRKENAELKASFLRIADALETTRKNVDRDVAARVTAQTRRVALALIDVADNLERAMAYAPADDALRPGVQATLQMLQATMAREGVLPMELAPGAAYDPHMHEAVTGHSADVERETVHQVVRTGYTLDGQVLRPAHVVVALPRA